MHIEVGELNGDRICLKPLSVKHEAGLIACVKDGELWELNVTLIPSPEHVLSYIKTALSAKKMHQEFPFVIIDRKTKKIVGTTRYRNIDIEHQRLEIGSTFIAKTYQRSYVNREAKFLLLSYAFDILGVNRVEFITDELNSISQKALEGIGAVKEGILREHMIMPDWRKRNSLIYSILRREWGQIKDPFSQSVSRM